MSSSVFANILSTYTSWPALKSFLTSNEGGRLRVYDDAIPDCPFALIRYVKGQSDFTIPHVGAFRSVVWDIVKNRPVSVTPFKSVEGESVPDIGSPSDYIIEQFIDGVLIGVFYDEYNDVWRIHTRSTLNANCRYYSQSNTFRDMFHENMNEKGYAELDKACCYSYVLRHPENRIVCPVSYASNTCVQVNRIGEDGTVTDVSPRTNFVVSDMTSWDAVKGSVAQWDKNIRHLVQGVVIKDATGKRWKLRTPSYNAVRAMRGNSARRDYIWLDSWRKNTLHIYLGIFPEEKLAAEATITNWKRVTNDVFRIYTEVFKARTVGKSEIPSKYRPLVYGLHSKFMEELKPAGKPLDWNTTLQYMNARDTAQMLFVINWEKRQAARELGATSIPIEPSNIEESEIIAALAAAAAPAAAAAAAANASSNQADDAHAH